MSHVHSTSKLRVPKPSPPALEARLVHPWRPRQGRSCYLHPSLEPAYHSRSQETGLGATHLPRSHCPRSCHADHWNSRSRCRMAVPRHRKVATEGRGTAGPSWPGWWQCQGILDEAGSRGNCREKENKPITEAPLTGGLGLLCRVLSSVQQAARTSQDTEESTLGRTTCSLNFQGGE